MKLSCRSILACCIPLVAALSVAGQTPNEVPQKTTVCQLLSDPKAWNKKLVEVTGIASHGFEDSGFSDPNCSIRYRGLWMEYGGKQRTGIKSTASNLDRTSLHAAKVEGVNVPLLKDALFDRFDDFLHQLPGDAVHTTVIARFFAGQLQHYPAGDSWGGYGHLGCCSLLMIQQVLAVDDKRRPDLDYGDEPEYLKADCIHFLTDPDGRAEMIEEQRSAEQGARSFAFSDDRRVAIEALHSYKKDIDPSAFTLTKTSSNAYRVTYAATVAGSKIRYLITLNKPYWLSFSAADPSKVAWVVLSASETCDKSGPNTVTVLKR